MRSVVGSLRSLPFGEGGGDNETPIFKILNSNRRGMRKLNLVETVPGRQFKWGVFLLKRNGGVY